MMRFVRQHFPPKAESAVDRAIEKLDREKGKAAHTHTDMHLKHMPLLLTLLMPPFFF